MNGYALGTMLHGGGTWRSMVVGTVGNSYSDVNMSMHYYETCFDGTHN